MGFLGPLPSRFLKITQNSFIWGCLDFLTFLTITCPLLEAGLLHKLPESSGIMDLIYIQTNFRTLDFDFWSLFGKPWTKGSRLHIFLRRNFASGILKWICTFSVFLELKFIFRKFCKYFFIFDYAVTRAFKKCIIIFRAHFKYLKFSKFANLFCRLLKWSLEAFQKCINCYRFVSQ